MFVTPHAVMAQGIPPSPPRARLVEELRLNAEVHDFPAVTRVWVGPRGQIVVPIQQDMQLRIFDSTGVLLNRTGRRGSGPEEFRSLGQFGWIADSMFVVDGQLRRVSYLSPDGKPLRSTLHWSPTSDPGAMATASAPLSQRISYFQPLAISGNGVVLGGANLRPPPGEEGSPFGALVVVRLDPDGRLTELLTIPSADDERWTLRLDSWGFGIPFTLWPQSAVSSRGDRVAHLWSAATSRAGGTFTVSSFRADGDTVFVRTFPFIGVPIPQSVRDSALAAMLPRPGRPTEGPLELHQRRQALTRTRIPPVYAGVEYFVLGLDGTIWVALRRTSEGTPLVALDADTGEPVAQVVLPPGVRLRQATRTRAWVTEADDDGVASVVRYRIEGVPRAR